MGTGKTSIAHHFESKKALWKEYIPTIGVDFASKTINVQNMPIRINIFDSAGQEAFRSITKSYFRNAAVALLVYDITDMSTFNRLPYWLSDIQNETNAIIFLIGNKVDKPACYREVTYRQGQNFCRQHQLQGFFEISAFNYEEIFNIIAQSAQVTIDRINMGYINVDDIDSGVSMGDFYHEDESVVSDISLSEPSSSHNINSEKYRCCITM